MHSQVDPIAFLQCMWKVK